MTALFYISLAIILYTYLGYPVLIAALARLRPHPWQRAPWPPNQPQRPISIIMAVHNGAALLPSQIDHLLTLEPHLVHEVIIVSDGSTDQTPALITQIPRPRLKPIILPVHSGKATALNAAITLATAEILLFIDIRPRVQPDAVAALLSNFADPVVGCVAGELLLTTPNRQHAHDPAASAISSLYWRYEQAIRNCEAAFHSPVGVYGGFYAIRRALATPFPEGLILDDMFQPLAIVAQGYRSVIDRTAFVVDQWPATTTGEFNRKVRTLAGNFQLIARAPWLLTPRNPLWVQLISHKLLRLAVPYCFALLLLTSTVLGFHSRPFALFAALQLALWLLAAASLKLRIPIFHRIAAPAGAMLVLNFAAVAALYRFLFTRGPLWKIWTTQAVACSPSSPQKPVSS